MKISKTLPFLLMSALLSNTSFAQDVNHSSVVQTAFYNQVDPKYHDSLYLFQLVLSKNCLTYRSEEEACKDYLKEKYDSVSSDWYQEQEPIKKQYLNIKLEMISNTKIVLADVHHGDQGYFSPIIADTQSIMDARINPELQSIIRRELSENNGKTGLDFVGAKQQLFVQYNNEAKRFHDAEIEQIDFSSPKPTKAEKIHYQELLFIQKYLLEKLSMTTAERELDKLLKDVIRDLVRCAECTTNPIVKTWNNSYVAYKEMSLSELMLLGLGMTPTRNAEILYPAEYFEPVDGGILLLSFYLTFVLILCKMNPLYLCQKNR